MTINITTTLVQSTTLNSHFAQPHTHLPLIILPTSILLPSSQPSQPSRVHNHGGIHQVEARPQIRRLRLPYHQPYCTKRSPGPHNARTRCASLSITDTIRAGGIHREIRYFVVGSYPSAEHFVQDLRLTGYCAVAIPASTEIQRRTLEENVPNSKQMCRYLA